MQKEIRTSGFWKVNNCGGEYGGDLYVNQSEGTIALELHIPNKGAPLSYFAIPCTINFITGKIASGAKITLIHCSRYKTRCVLGKEEVFGYTARFLVNGYCFDSIDRIIFSQVSIRLSNLLEWGGISKYDMDFIKGYDFQLLAKYIEPTLLFSDDSIKISYMLYSNSLSMETMKEELVFKQEPNIIIESTVDQPIDFFIEKLIGIKRIVELAIGVKTDILEIKCETSEITRQIGNSTIPVEFEMLHHYPQRDSHSPLRSFEILFNMQDLIGNASLAEWFKKYALLEPILELYIEDLNNTDLSLNRRFLNMVQSLETYHSRIVCNGTLANYKNRVEKILKDVPAVNKKSHEDLLLADCKSKITLKGIIYDLLLAKFEIFFDTGDISHTEFPQKIADTRNYLTHYDINKKEKVLHGQALADVYITLKIILEYYIMRELGFNSEFTHAKIKEKEKSFRTLREIRALDKKTKGG